MKEVLKNIFIVFCLMLSLTFNTSVGATDKSDTFFNVGDVNESNSGSNELNKDEENVVNNLLEVDPTKISEIPIEYAETFFKVIDNQILIDSDLLVDTKIDDTQKAFILQSIQYTNELLENKKSNLIINDDFEFFDKNDDDAHLNGGNINRSETHWWGMLQFRSYKTTKNFVSKGRNSLYLFDYISSAAGAVGAVSSATGFVPGALASGLLSSSTGVIKGVFTKYYRQLEYNNKKSINKGTVTCMPWSIVGYRIEHQTYKTK